MGKGGGKGKGCRSQTGMDASVAAGAAPTHQHEQQAIQQALNAAVRESAALPPHALRPGWGVSNLRLEWYPQSETVASSPAQQASWDVLSQHLLDSFPQQVEVLEGDWWGTKRRVLALQLVEPADSQRAGQPSAALEMLAEWNRDSYAPDGGWQQPRPSGALAARISQHTQQLAHQQVAQTVAKRAQRKLKLREELPQDWAEQMVQALGSQSLDGQARVIGHRLSPQGVEPVYRYSSDPKGAARRHMSVIREDGSISAHRWDTNADLDDATLEAAAAYCGFLDEDPRATLT